MQAVSKELQVLITQLQALPSLESFALAGGTNLALRYNHRISVDIDFFVPEIVGGFGLRAIQNEVAKYYKDSLLDEIQLDDLMKALAVKKDKYKLPEHRCLFDLDHEISPLDNLAVLLEFDSIDYNNLPSRPSHSNDRIFIVPPSKEWKVARNSWRRKVRDLMRARGIEPPSVSPIN